jgi:hypothetical protein
MLAAARTEKIEIIECETGCPRGEVPHKMA